MDFQGIRQARKAAGITQEELAHILGINRATLSKYESGVIEPSISQLLSIASALNTSLPELLGFKYGNEVLFTVEMSPELVQALGLPEYANQLATSNPELMMRIVSEFSRQSPEKIQLNTAFERLNDDGQHEAVKRVEELGEIPRYQAQQSAQPSPVDSTGQDTPAPVGSAEDYHEDEWDRGGGDRYGGRRDE